MGSKPMPKAPPGPPAPEDSTIPFFRELARRETDRALRRTSGLAAAFGESLLDPDFSQSETPEVGQNKRQAEVENPANIYPTMQPQTPTRRARSQGNAGTASQTPRALRNQLSKQRTGE